MTVAMHSFDASPLGVFIRSPLGARNGIPTPPEVRVGVMAMIWQDEADGYDLYPHVYMDDVAAYMGRLEALWQADPPVATPIVPIMHVLGIRGVHESLGPEIPHMFWALAVGRPPTFEENRAAFLSAIVTNINPLSGQPMTLLEHVRLTVDGSGSLQPGGEGPGVMELRDWLRARRGREVVQGIVVSANAIIEVEESHNERWVLQGLPAT